MKPIFTILLLIAAFTTTTQAKETDFDIVCTYFQELEALPNLAKMNHIQRNEFILSRIHKILPNTSNARAAREPISAVVASQRYYLFKSATESVINHKWDCPAMKRLAYTTGVFK